MTTRTWLSTGALIALAFAYSCVPEGAFVLEVSQNTDSLALSGAADSTLTTVDTVLVPGDTVVVFRVDTVLQNPDTVIIARVDTLVVPPDTVVVTTTDTVVNGIDTVEVTRVDTIVSPPDTVVVATFDTVVTADTVVLSIVDTLIRTDTLVQVDTVVAPPNTLRLSSDALQLEVGQSATLTSTPVNALGFPVESGPTTWISEDPAIASVSSTGTVLGVSVGSVKVFAISEGISASLTVDVVSSAPPPPPAVAEAFPNLPPSFSIISEREFGALDEGGWRHQVRASGSYDIVSDASAPYSPPNTGRQTFRAPLDGGEPAIVWYNWGSDQRFNRMYISTRLKLSANWDGHDSGVNKLFYARIGKADSYSRFYLTASGAGPNPLRLRGTTQNTPLGDQRLIDANLGETATITRGTWHHIEVILIANTGDNYDGEIHLWLDGRKIAEYRDVIWAAPTEEQRWRGFEWTPVWGGNGSEPLTAEQYMWLDHVLIAGGN